MKNQALFSSKDKSKKLKCLLLQFLFGTLMVNMTRSGCGVVDNMLHYQSRDRKIDRPLFWSFR